MKGLQSQTPSAKEYPLPHTQCPAAERDIWNAGFDSWNFAQGASSTFELWDLQFFS